jgi:hypothetical protein
VYVYMCMCKWLFTHVCIDVRAYMMFPSCACVCVYVFVYVYVNICVCVCVYVCVCTCSIVYVRVCVYTMYMLYTCINTKMHNTNANMHFMWTCSSGVPPFFEGLRPGGMLIRAVHLHVHTCMHSHTHTHTRMYMQLTEVRCSGVLPLL